MDTLCITPTFNMFKFYENNYFFMKKIFDFMNIDENIFFTRTSTNIYNYYIQYKKTYNIPRIYRPSQLFRFIPETHKKLEKIIFLNLIEKELKLDSIYSINDYDINYHSVDILSVVNGHIYICKLHLLKKALLNNKYIIPYNSLAFVLKKKYSYYFLRKYINNWVNFILKKYKITYLTEKEKYLIINMPNKYYINRCEYLLNMSSNFKYNQMVKLNKLKATINFLYLDIKNIESELNLI